MESMSCGFILWELKFVAACVPECLLERVRAAWQTKLRVSISRSSRKYRGIPGLANVDGLLL